MVRQAGFLSQISQAESRLETQLHALQLQVPKRIERQANKIRKKAKETIEESPEQIAALERIEHLRLRLELLRNIRMNWKSFGSSLKKKGMSMRINQDAHLKHLISFLETGKGIETGFGEEEMNAAEKLKRELMTHEIQPTGAGKTGAFAIDIALMDVPSLTLVPFDSLLDQTKKDLMKIGGIPESDIGIVGGGTKEVGVKHTIATYAGHAALMRKRGEYADFMRNQCKLVICDEVHHQALGDRTQTSLMEIDQQESDLTSEERDMLRAEEEILQHLADQTSVKSLKIGFTATPKGAKKHVQKYFPHCLGRVYHREMVEAGQVVPYEIVQCDGRIFEGEIEEYLSEKQEVEILTRENIYGKLLGEYAEVLATYRKTKVEKKDYPMRGMAFCTNHQECEKFALEASRYGLRCKIVTGKEAKGRDGQRVIDEAVQSIENGECDLLVTVEKLATGFNWPAMNAVIWARITSAAKTIQGIGRGGRAHTDEEGRVKTHCTVFETDWKLQGKKGRKPMRLADALAFNGEDPEAICRMADGSMLIVNRPLRMEEVREIIIEKFTPKSWAKLTIAQRGGRNFADSGMGIRAIATIFGAAENPLYNSENHHALGRIIWGIEEYGDPEQEEREHVRAILMNTYTPETWIAIDRKGKEKICVEGKHIKAISTLFGGSPSEFLNYDQFLFLGRKIWGDHPVFLEKERYLKSIQSTYSADSWASFTSYQRAELKVEGKGLHALCSIFGIEGNAKSNHEHFLALGRAIWGDLPILRSSKDDFSSLIRASYTPEQ